jgi:hypothetical protein
VYRSVRTIRGKVYDNVSCTSCGASGDYDWYQRMVGVKLHHMKEDRVTEEERLTAWLAGEALWLQLQDALGRLERLERGLYLAGTPEFAALPAGQFAREVLGEAA